MQVRLRRFWVLLVRIFKDLINSNVTICVLNTSSACITFLCVCFSLSFELFILSLATLSYFSLYTLINDPSTRIYRKCVQKTSNWALIEKNYFLFSHILHTSSVIPHNHLAYLRELFHSLHNTNTAVPLPLRYDTIHLSSRAAEPRAKAAVETHTERAEHTRDIKTSSSSLSRTGD